MNNALTFTFDQLTTALSVDGQNANDALIYDISNGLPRRVLFSGGLSVSPLDQVIIQGNGTVGELEFVYDTENDGSVNIDGNEIVEYSGIAPLTSTVTVTDVVLSFGSSDETIDFTQAGTDITVDSTVGEITTFAAPTNALTINTGGGTDTINVDGPVSYTHLTLPTILLV